MLLRVAAYCRVSTDREDQANSLSSQKRYFAEYIKQHEDWILADIYPDEGISGTTTRHREQFNRMIRDAEAGKIDLILTKEVSRFARNTVDTLEYTRRLKRLGVGVIFTNDNIDTRDNDGELRLTIMASIAQEESRKTSERVKWGQKRRMEAGVVFGSNCIYGFDLTNGQLTVKEDEAQIIRHIYHKFLNEGKGTHVIARELYEEGVPPPKSATGKWSCVMIRRILRNEKYVGDVLQKKFVTVDYLTHKKVENRGQEEQILLQNHHEAILDRPTWEAVQAELARRAEKRSDKSKYSRRYWCSGKIRCGACGSRFVPKITHRRNGDTYKIWECHSRAHYGNRKQNSQGDYVGCSMRILNDKTLTTCVQFVLQQLDLDYDTLAQELASDIQNVLTNTPQGKDRSRLQIRQADLERRKERVMDSYFGGDISKEEMLQMKAKYDEELEKINVQLLQYADMERIQAEQTRELQELAQTIREYVSRSEEVFAEAVEEIVVCEESITIKVHYIPLSFRIWYSTSGTRENYATKIERWEVVHPAPPTELLPHSAFSSPDFFEM